MTQLDILTYARLSIEHNLRTWSELSYPRALEIREGLERDLKEVNELIEIEEQKGQN